MINNCKFRYAKEDDNIHDIAKYIYLTDSYIYPAIADAYDSPVWEEIIKQCFTTKGSVFYYENIIVVEYLEKIVGILCFLEGGRKYSFLEGVTCVEVKNEKIRIVDNEYFKHLFKETLKIKGINICNVCIESKFQRNGLGTKLLELCIEQHKKQDLYLCVLKENKPAIGLYEKVGFKKIDEYDGFSTTVNKPTCYFMKRKG